MSNVTTIREMLNSEEEHRLFLSMYFWIIKMNKKSEGLESLYDNNTKMKTVKGTLIVHIKEKWSIESSMARLRDLLIDEKIVDKAILARYTTRNGRIVKYIK